MTEDTRTTEEKRAAHARDPILLSVRLMNTCPHNKLSRECCGYAEWLQVIHAVNRLVAGSFGEPLAMYDWWAGGWCEEYERFRVILRDDSETANVQAKTPGAANLLKDAVLEVTGREVDDNGFPITIHRP